MPKPCSKRNTAGKLLIILAAIALFGCAAARPVEKEERIPWGTYMNNESRTNASSEKIALPASLLWSNDITSFKLFSAFPKEELSAPAVSNGAVYAGSSDGLFYSFDLNTGRVLWKFDALFPIDAPPSIAGSLVCFGTGNGIMRCLDVYSGKEAFMFQARSGILSAPLIKDDRIYFSSADDRVYALSSRNGEKLWVYNRSTFQTVSPRLYGSPAYASDKLYQLFSDGYLVCIDASTGKEVWNRKVVKNFSSAEPTRRTPLIDGNIVYVIDDNGAIVALNTDSGGVQGIYNLVKANDFILKDKRTFIITGANQISALDRLTGAILWKRALQYRPAVAIFSTVDHFFVLSNFNTVPFGINFLASRQGYIQAFRLKDGAPIWSRKLSSTVSANAAMAEERLVILTDEGDISVFGPK